MSITRMQGVIGRLRQAATAVPASDGQLLDAFIKERDHAAFEKLLRRHGAMVLGVCRRVAGADEADDAFQATFLVLVRKAASIVPREAVGNWLYGVAYRTAMRARAEALRRRAKEKQVNDMPHPVLNGESTWTELEQALDRELSRLPDKHRLPIVLCDLEGRTRREVARQLGIPDGTLSNRLAAGRRLLARRLAKLGFPVAGGAVGTWLAEQAAAASVPGALVEAALGMAASGSSGAKVAALATGVVKGMLLAKLTKAAVCVAVCAVVGLGGAGYRAAALAQADAGAGAPGAAAAVAAAAAGQRGPEAEAKRRAEVLAEAAQRAQAALVWSEVFEREMTFFDHDKKTNHLDLDTGEHVELPLRAGQAAPDLSASLGLSDTRSRTAAHMAVAQVGPEQFDAKPADVLDKLAAVPAKKSQIVGGGTRQTYFFKTAAGNTGVLHLQPVNEATGLVKVRWKLLVPPAKQPAPRPHLKLTWQLDLDKLLLGSWIGRGGLVPSALMLKRDGTFLLGFPGNFAAETGNWDLNASQLPLVLTLHITKSDDRDRVGAKLQWELRELNETKLTMEDRDKQRTIAYQRPTEKGLAPDSAEAEIKLPQGLEFLRPIREFHGFRFGQDEATIRRIAKEQSLTVTGTAAKGFIVTRTDGETLALSMRDGACSGIQRLGKR